MSLNGPVDRGSGMVGTSAGFLVFLLLLFAAVQILFNLYATSMVAAAARDAAHHVAGFDSADDRCAASGNATSAFIEALGSYGAEGHARLEWDCSQPRVVRVRVIAVHPSILPPRLAGLGSLRHLDRTIEVHLEAER